MSAPAHEPASVLEAPPPRFTAGEVAAIVAELFGVRGELVETGSERDQTFLLDDGGRGAVVKVSNLGEDQSVLDLETEALLHIARTDPELPVALPRPAEGAPAGIGPEAYRPTAEGPDGAHFVRVFDRLPGRSDANGAELDDAALYDFGATLARLGLAMRGFWHPAAGRELLWNLKFASRLRPLAPAIADPRQRALVEAVLDRYDERVLPRWGALRSQVLHGDVVLDNVLVDDRLHIAGIVDFGDIAHSAVVADPAVALGSLLRGRPMDDVFRSARIVLDGYASRVPLEPLELDLVGDLVAARLATIVTISAWRVERYPENAEYIQNWDADSWELLDHFAEAGPDAVTREIGGLRGRVRTAELAGRRQRALGSAITALTYRRPVHAVRGEGVWIEDADGTRLLDVYNNVPVVGHCHPRVTEAVVRQTRTLNTHARYLYEPLVELAERLAASMPEGSGLDTVMLVNSGSEANDVAWRIAKAVTGNGGAIVTSYAYHGVTTAIADVSPEEWVAGQRPGHVRTIEPPGRGAQAGAEMARAAADLDAGGHGLAATFVDGGFTSDGILTPSAAEVAELVERTRAAGGVYVADEVQAGHGRTGEHLWSFECYGITPDAVTLGKPMGNGYPVAAVITRADLVDRFAETTDFFSTFGGNPVAAQAALAVLDVIDDLQLVEHAGRVGAALRRLLGEVARRHADAVIEVRGRGLLVGVELSSPDVAGRVVEGLRERGVLVGRTGPRGDVLKIRPPLVFAAEHAELLAERLDHALGAAAAQ